MTGTAPTYTGDSSRWLRQHASSVRGRLAAAVALGEAAGMLLVLQTGLLAKVADGVIFGRSPVSALLPLFAGALGAILMRAAAAAAARRAASRCASQVKRTLRAECVGHLERIGPLGLTGLRAGEIAHVSVDAVEALDAYYSKYLPQRAIASMLPFTILAVVFPLDWISGLVLVFTAVFLPVSMIVIGEQALERNQRLWGRLAGMSGRFLDVLQGLATVRMFDAVRGETAEIERASREHRVLTMSVLRIAFLSSFMLELISAVSIAIVAVISGFRLLHGSMAFSPAYFILLVAPEYFLTLRTLGTLHHSRMEAISAAEQIRKFLEIPAGGEAAPGTAPGSFPGRHGRITRAPAISFRGVDFSYGTASVLSGLSLEVAGSEHLALTGKSGAGKSTFLALLNRFARPQQGTIEIDGVPLAALDPAEWRRVVAWLPQRPTLFHGSVRDNVRLGRPDASEQELRRAMSLARVGEVAMDTRVGEAGQGLSTGQTQRVALARLFLRAPLLVLLDEPTAHLDAENAAMVSAGIRELCAERTAILVTHRAESAAGMDRVVELRDGRAGPHP
ncbi:MAG: thiol reductant ABC exporter subunit CydD [Spirochaetia bacterium]|jgi:ATP-binding cassette subfamily C protein CydD